MVIAFPVFSFEAWDGKKRSLWVHGGSLTVHAENFSAKTNRPNKEARSLPVVIVNVLFVWFVCVCLCKRSDGVIYMILMRGNSQSLTRNIKID